jgi:hypothetical protein
MPKGNRLTSRWCAVLTAKGNISAAAALLVMMLVRSTVTA